MLSEKARAVLIVALLLLSAVGGVATVTAAEGAGDRIVAASNGDETPLNETVSNATEAYVTDDGSVVLVYDYEDTDDLEATSGHASMDVADGVAEFVMSQEAETDATGNLTLAVTPDEMSADGELIADRPAPLEDLRFELDSVQNQTVSESSMALNSTVAVPENSELSLAFFLAEARTSGSVTTDATSLHADGSASVDLDVSPLPERSHEFVLTEQDGSYTLDVEESYTLGENETEDWNTSDRAQTTLEAQYCDGINTTNVTCGVSLDEYNLTETGDDSQRLDLAYTVTIDGVDAAISEVIVQEFTGDEANMTEAEATELADRIENVSLSHVEAELAVESDPTGGQQASVAWNVSLDGTDDLTLAYVDLLERIEQVAATSQQTPETGLQSGTFGLADTAEQLREQTEARRAADLQTTSEWAFVLTTDRDQSVVNLNGTATAETTNWDDYVTELNERDIPITDSMRTALDVRTDGDRIVADGSATVTDEGMLDRALTEYNRTIDQPEVAEVIDAIRAADFEYARLNASVADGTATVQGNLSVGDGTPISDQLPHPLSMVEASETDLDTGQTAILMDAGLGSDADEDTVRALSFVDDETEINMPGEWGDERPSVVPLVASSDDASNTTEEGDGSGPGFGPVLALLGAAGGAMIAGRRLRDR